MSISKLIKDMQAAGAPIEAITIAVEAIEALQAQIVDNKNKTRDRVRKHRDMKRYGNVTEALHVTPTPLNGSDGFPDPSLTSLNPTKENTPKGVQKKSTQKETVDLPDWMPLEAWQGFREMRIKIKKPMTPRAERMAISKLEDFRSRGHDPTEILNQSTFNDYQDLYEIKENQVFQNKNISLSFDQKAKKATDLAIEEVLRHAKPN